MVAFPALGSILTVFFCAFDAEDSETGGLSPSAYLAQSNAGLAGAGCGSGEESVTAPLLVAGGGKSTVALPAAGSILTRLLFGFGLRLGRSRIRWRLLHAFPHPASKNRPSSG